jgi:hypothetical protein
MSKHSTQEGETVYKPTILPEAFFNQGAACIMNATLNDTDQALFTVGR